MPVMFPLSRLAYIESKKNEIHHMVCKEGMKVPQLQEAFCRRFCMDNTFWAHESQLRTALKRWEEEEPERWAGQWNKRATMPEPHNAQLYVGEGGVDPNQQLGFVDSSRRSWPTSVSMANTHTRGPAGYRGGFENRPWAQHWEHPRTNEARLNFTTTTQGQLTQMRLEDRREVVSEDVLSPEVSVDRTSFCNGCFQPEGQGNHDGCALYL